MILCSFLLPIPEQRANKFLKSQNDNTKRCCRGRKQAPIKLQAREGSLRELDHTNKPAIINFFLEHVEVILVIGVGSGFDSDGGGLGGDQNRLSRASKASQGS
ncbi:hypothetical protein SLA2020_236660 [Shorea laevis]